jgi:hypothetical protein
MRLWLQLRLRLICRCDTHVTRRLTRRRVTMMIPRLSKNDAHD